MTKYILIFGLLSLLGYCLAEDRKYVSSVEDFYLHTQNHVNNVARLAERVTEIILSSDLETRRLFHLQGDESLKDLKKLVKEVIYHHDKGKLNVSKTFLDRHGLDKGLIYELYDFYGKSPANAGELEVLKKSIKRLNDIDQGVMEATYEKNKVSPQIKKFLEEVEKIADQVERGENPVTPEEMNRAVKPASEFMGGGKN